jgi:hypothetical protein
MNKIFTRFTLIAALVAVGSVYGCGSDTANTGSTGDEGGSTGTGGKKATGGSGGSVSTGTGGAKASGGAGGSGKDASPASDTDEPATDADEPSDDSGTAVDSSVGGDVSTPDTSGTGGTPGSDAAAGGLLACWPDPKVIKICHQLENACENCGPTKGKACGNGKYPQICACFDLIEKAFKGMATDEDCVKFAAANDCKVDNATTTGNICGSLNCELPDCKCNTPGCGDEANRGKTCSADQHYGDAAACQKWVSKCSCK